MMSNTIYTSIVHYSECPSIFYHYFDIFLYYSENHSTYSISAKHFVNNDGYRSIEMICTTNRLILLFNVHMT